MCGIAGHFSTSPLPSDALEKMVVALKHRGPDATGYYQSDFFQAGMSRLSINDLEKGDQPLFNKDKSIVLFYNGEIYNSPELRKELEKKGYQFRTRSDGEVVCHLYEEKGEEAFAQLDGMFAIALWLKTQQKLILARDLQGEKPLYYCELPQGGWAFASEVKSLLCHPQVKDDLNHQALWDFPTFLWVPEPDTAYQHIKALPRGSLLVLQTQESTQKSIPNSFEVPKHDGSDQGLIEATRQVVESTVRSRLLSDVPLGAFLSGGLDSSIVSAVASQNLSALNTYTIGFEDLKDPYHGKVDEASEAKEFAKRLGTRHRTIRVTAQSFKEMLHDFCHYGDQPFAVSSGLGVLAIAQAASEDGIKVLLTGDGADEAFGGYSWYPYLSCENHFEDKITQENVSWQTTSLSVDQRVSAIHNYKAAQQAWAWHYYASEEDKISFYHRDLADQSLSSLRFFSEFKNQNKWQPSDFIEHDRKFYFPNEMLKKADRMTMARSVEGRIPFAGAQVQALADQLENSHRIRHGQLKWILRQAFADLLPAEILNRSKHGFNVPIDHWLKNEWSDLLEQTFSSGSYLHKYNLIQKDSLSQAHRFLNDPHHLHGHTLFCFIMLNLWLESVHGNHR